MVIIKLELDAQGIIEVSAAIAQAIALMDERSSGEQFTYHTPKKTLRHLLTDIHKQCAISDNNNYSERTSYQSNKQLLF